MRLVYFDCYSGAAGDMLLGALLDAGAPEQFVRESLETLSLPGWTLKVESVTRRGLRATKAHVNTHGDATTERNYADVVSLLETSPLTDEVKATALRTFTLLAQAEARVHGAEVGDVHFHEVGALDAVVDIVGSAAGLVALRPDRVECSPIPLGTGEARSAHGPLPVPAPAVTELLRGVPVVGRGPGELTTPTGAAFLVAVSDRFGDIPPMELTATGYGAGEHDYERPNVLRVLLGETAELDASVGDRILIETNLDDVSPELLPHVIDSLLAAGADDAWVAPIVMKKGRAAFTLTALARSENEDRLVDLIYRETTSFGLRTTAVRKHMLERRWVEVEVGGEKVRVKLGLRGSSILTLAPEYDDALRAARATGLPLKDVFARASSEARSSVT